MCCKGKVLRSTCNTALSMHGHLAHTTAVHVSAPLAHRRAPRHAPTRLHALARERRLLI